MTTEIIIMWVAVTLYAVSAAACIISLVFTRRVALTAGLALAWLGVGVHAAGIAWRWVRIGHGPFLGFYEVVSSYVFVAVLALLCLIAVKRSLAPVAAVLMPVAFLGLGGAMLAPKSDLGITGTLASWWLGIHVAFAKLAFGSFLVAAALAVTYLLRSRREESAPDEDLTSGLRLATLDDLTFRFVGSGFIFLGIMIVAGAIWANEAWGRYWGWDPIETWSLIAWLIYAVVIHLRVTMGWRGARFAKVAIAALPVMVFAAVGVVVVTKSIHGAYLIGY